MKLKWVTNDEAEKIDCIDLGGLGGMIVSCTLKEFIETYPAEHQKYITFLAKEIKENKYVFEGRHHQSNDYTCCPVVYCDNKPTRKFTFSYRGLGDLLHCIYIDKSGIERGYCDFYCRTPDCLDLNFPCD